MDLGLTKKNVLVIGASKGIGRAVAKSFAKEKANVTVVARSEDRLVTLLEEIKNDISENCYEVCDLMQPGNPTKLAEKLLKQNKIFDVVVHAVGGPLEIRDPLSSVEQWSAVWYYNCGIAIEMNRLLIPPMRKQKWGRVIHISSISGIMLRGAAPYASAKAYLNAYTTTLGRAIAQDGVVVSAILPGAVSFEGSYWDKFVKENHPRVDDFLSHHQAVGRMGTPEEIACFAVFLGSKQASFAPAALLNIDGGNM